MSGSGKVFDNNIDGSMQRKIDNAYAVDDFRGSWLLQRLIKL
jgi:hypothetical protein